jgi:signal peptidase I
MLGDNRDASLDSRVPAPEGFGAVPFENLIGRAQIIHFSIREGERFWILWRWPWSIRWSRLFTVVR